MLESAGGTRFQHTHLFPGLGQNGSVDTGGRSGSDNDDVYFVGHGFYQFSGGKMCGMYGTPSFANPSTLPYVTSTASARTHI